MSEDAHRGKFGSIARSVNIQIDKLGREAKSAKKDLDQLLGPAPEGGLGTIDLLATALPSVRPGGPAPAVPPPPSEFRFQDSGLMAASARKPPARAAAVTPPPFRTVAPPGPPQRSSQPFAASQQPGYAPQPPLNLDDDILGRGSAELDVPRGEPPALRGEPSAPRFEHSVPRIEPSVPRGSAPRAEPYFKQIFDQFIAVKRRCNEPTAGLVYERFAEKLVKNREDLILKTGCREVRFTVYVKDGKAALKATPVKDDA
jgi:hypothetical protein